MERGLFMLGVLKTERIKADWGHLNAHQLLISQSSHVSLKGITITPTTKNSF